MSDRLAQARDEAERRWPGQMALAPVMKARFLDGVAWADENPGECAPTTATPSTDAPAATQRRGRLTDINYRSDMGVTLVDHMGDDRRIAQAARVSTVGLDNDRDKYVGLVRALIREGHWSPLEACAMTVAFDVPTFTRDQIIRHKSLSYSVFSLRYSEAKPDFWVPAEGRPLVQVGKALDYRREAGDRHQNIFSRALMRNAAADAWEAYQDMIDGGIANEVARTVLPSSIYSPFWTTGNLRSWLHFVALRNDEHAQYEVREAAAKVEEIIGGLWPVALEAFREEK